MFSNLIIQKRLFVHRVQELFEVQKINSLNIVLNGIQTTKVFMDTVTVTVMVTVTVTGMDMATVMATDMDHMVMDLDIILKKMKKSHF